MNWCITHWTTMQRQRINLHLVCEFDTGSSSNTSGIDQHNLLLNPVDTLPSYLLSPASTPLQHGNVQQENPCYDICNSGSSSVKRSINEDCHDEAEREQEHESMHSPPVNVEGGFRIEGTWPEATASMPLENMNLDLDMNQIDHGQPPSLPPNFPSNAENFAMSTQDFVSSLSPLPSLSGLLTPDQILLANASWDTSSISSGGIGLFSGHNRVRQFGEPDDCRSCRKRTGDGMPGQPSASRNSSYFHQNGTSSLNIPSSSHSTGLHQPTMEQVTPGIDTITIPVASVHHLSANAQASLGAFPRNTRMRTNLHQNDASLHNLLLQGSSSSHSHQLPAHQQHISSTPAYQSHESRLLANISSSNNQPLAIAGAPALIRTTNPFQLNGTLSSGMVGEGSTLSLGSTSASNNPYQMLLVPLNNTNNPVSGSPTRNLTNGSRSIHIGIGSTPRADDNASIHQPTGSSFVSRQFHSHPNHRVLSEIVRRSVLSSVAHSGSHGVLLQQNGSHGQQPYFRQALWTDRQNNNLLGVPLSMQIPAARRDIRSRMLLEDILIFDQSGLFGSADLHDRHRDMRLDVDNMSYEELLALEERIGNVSTGLSEEMITKFLRRRMYISITLLPLEEVEPCCICREEYEEGEEVGRLDCGHDFHSACIKQWLVLKNLCPICRTTALDTPKNG